MTRRERLERKLEKRKTWAEGAHAKSDAAFATAAQRAEAIPMGQPILVGHHSERRDRRYRARIAAGMDRGVEQLKKAEHHESKARGLAIALERSIYDDDPDAQDKLREKITTLEVTRDMMKRANAAFRKDGAAGLVAVLGEGMAADAMTKASYTADKVPFPRYQFTNTSAEIRRCKKRLEQIEARRVREGAAFEAGGIKIWRDREWCRVQFSDRPSRDVLKDLRAAGYRWGLGMWQGRLEKLPASVLELEQEAVAAVTVSELPTCYACEQAAVGTRDQTSEGGQVVPACERHAEAKPAALGCGEACCSESDYQPGAIIRAFWPNARELPPRGEAGVMEETAGECLCDEADGYVCRECRYQRRAEEIEIDEDA